MQENILLKLLYIKSEPERFTVIRLKQQNRKHSCDTIGQKHCRLASPGAVAMLCVSSNKKACLHLPPAATTYGGQKYGRLTRLEHFVILPISSSSRLAASSAGSASLRSS